MRCGDIEKAGIYPFVLGKLCCMNRVKQCGRRLCDKHIEIRYNQFGYVDFVCCFSDDGIRTECKKIYIREYCKMILYMLLFAGLVDGILSIFFF